MRLAKSCIKTPTEIERFKALADNAYQIAGTSIYLYTIIFVVSINI